MDLLQSYTIDLTPALGASLTSVFGDNVQDLLNAGALNVKPTGIIVVNSIDDVVGSDTDNGVTTLRDAINRANTDAGEDLIVFDRSVFTNAQTITLNLGELDITHNLDIIAPKDSLTGGDLVTVSGNNASRVFEIEFGATVSLDGLIVDSGKVTGDDGGGIKNSGTLTLDSSIVRNDFARNGGGIFNDNDASLTVSNSTISNNNSVSTNMNGAGGGIYNMGGTVTVSNSTLSGNSAGNLGFSNSYGGGIYNNGALTVSSSTISANLVSSYGGFGGGIYNTDSAVATVSDSIISDNSASLANSLLSKGGGIYNNGNLTVSNSTLSGNSIPVVSQGSSGSGGGIYNDGILTVSNSTISLNKVSGYANAGGGIYNDNMGMAMVSNSTISDNSSRQRGAVGGGICNIGTLMVSNSTISGNLVGTYVGVGGGIYNSGTLTVSNSTISHNSATGEAAVDGGGISNSGTLTLSNSTIDDNSISSGDISNSGGGIYNSGTLAVINSTIGGNSASITSTSSTKNKAVGGGIYNSGALTLVFSTLTGNQADNGGGVFNDPNSSGMKPPGSAKVRNTIIVANLLSTDGVNPDVSGSFTSNGYNLIGDGTGSTGFGEATCDIVGTSDNPIDPRLAPLDFNGGPTQTIALLPDSPAIGAADPTVLDTDPITDQRGLPRHASNGRADIGAFEFSQV